MVRKVIKRKVNAAKVIKSSGSKTGSVKYKIVSSTPINSRSASEANEKKARLRATVKGVKLTGNRPTKSGVVFDAITSGVHVFPGNVSKEQIIAHLKGQHPMSKFSISRQK